MKRAFWTNQTPAPDTYAAFRAVFDLPSTGRVEIQTLGSSWYRVWLDGEWLLEGPMRFALTRPEYDTHRAGLTAGRHLLAFHVHHVGADTRMMRDTPPFIWCRVLCDGVEVPLRWTSAPLPGYRSCLRRINPQLGWMEHCASGENPRDWWMPAFDDSAWASPVEIDSALPEPTAIDLDHVLRLQIPMKEIARGELVTTFGYPEDEPPLIFYLRNRQPDEPPAEGIWRRYDLGRIRLGSPEFRIKAPAGTVVEIAYSEQLFEGRVFPWINLSLGHSSNMDRYILRGGEETIIPLTPKGGRFVEIHIVNSLEAEILSEHYFERTYRQPTEAAFSCDDPLLEKIWHVGVETYRACTEDTQTDNPTRERGQWINDISSVHLALAASTYSDLRLSRRALTQAADCPREDGLIAAMCPGGPQYLPTVALQWLVGAYDYYEVTADRSLLEQIYPAAVHNLSLFEAKLEADGMHGVDGWNFIDWGYKNEDPVDLASNLHYLLALRSMVKWCEAIGKSGAHYQALATKLAAILGAIVENRIAQGFSQLGYHATVLGLKLGLVPEELKVPALDHMEHHLLDCFPNSSSAPRNYDPLTYKRQVITPFFAHYAFPLLIEAGRMDFALDQYRKCWGWMLGEGRTTWVEVFDLRWSHCHAWAGSPTWQLTRYCSGLHPRADLGGYEWKFFPGSLQRASVRLPHFVSGKWIDIQWERRGREIHYHVTTNEPFTLHGFPGREAGTHVKDKFEGVVSAG